MRKTINDVKMPRMFEKLILLLLFSAYLYLTVDARIKHMNNHQTIDNNSKLSNCSGVVDPCQNGGTCFNGTCVCPAEFTGRLCEIQHLCETQWIWDERVKYHVHPPVCYPVCRFPQFEPPVLSKRTFRYADTYNWIVAEIEFECEAGYLLIGPHQLKCVSDGQWDREVPKCKPICSDPGIPPHGFRLNYSRRIQDIFTTGTSFTFQCHQGYYLNGTETIKCTESGEWSADVPQCLPVTPLATHIQLVKASTRSQSLTTPVIDKSVHSPIINSSGTITPDRLLRLIRPKDLVKEATTSKQLIKYADVLLNNQSVICGIRNESHNNTTESTAWPWQTTLLSYDKSGKNYYIICAGNLISDRWVVTAAHCVSQLGKRKSYPADYFKVVLGEEPGFIEMDIKNIFIHPNYHPISNDSDIALIELNEAVELSANVYPICLPPPLTHLNTIKALNYELPHGTIGRVAGWGSPWGRSPPEKFEIFKMTVVNRKFCEEDFTLSLGTDVTITANMFCAEVVQPGGYGACPDDGGGSFAVQEKNEGTKQWVLHGIVSMGTLKCGPRYTIFVNLPHYVPWIRDTLHA